MIPKKQTTILVQDLTDTANIMKVENKKDKEIILFPKAHQLFLKDDRLF